MVRGGKAAKRQRSTLLNTLFNFRIPFTSLTYL
jgi:hypothetical protein